MHSLNPSLSLWLLMTPLLPALLAAASGRAGTPGTPAASSAPAPGASPASQPAQRAASADAAAAERVSRIQAALREAGIDGWLFYDFRGSNPIASRILLMPEGAIGTRRWFYFVPAQGDPVRIVHAIEPGRLDHLPGTKRVYLAWGELQTAIKDALRGAASQGSSAPSKPRQIAMEYSPDGAIPYVSKVDAGTVEHVRKTGASVVSSADLVQRFEAVWNPAQRQQHERAAVALRSVVDEAWKMIARRIRVGGGLDERTLQQHLWQRMQEMGLEADHAPIVAVGAHAAEPHYDPPETGSAPIQAGDLVLIDIWGKLKETGAVYADITWVGVVAESVPERYDRIWKIVRQARDAALEFVQKAAVSGSYPAGWQVDEVARGVIFQAGFGPNFIHRTGHSIGEEVHGDGANLDNLETHDERRLLPGTCFSIEPGIYLKGDFGIRSEIDVFLDAKQATPTGGPPQTEIVPILAGVPGA